MRLRTVKRRLAAANPETRARAMQEWVGPGNLPKEAVPLLIKALSDEDTVVQEWATVGLRRCRDRTTAVEALWACYRDTRERDSTRTCALAALEHWEEFLPPKELASLVKERVHLHDDPLLATAIYAAGQHGESLEMLQCLAGCRPQIQRRGDAKLRMTLNAALRRCAEGALIAGKVTNETLDRLGLRDVKERLGIPRVQARIEQLSNARRQESFLSPGWSSATGPTTVPGRPLAKLREEQYAEDLADWTQRRRVEGTRIVRDKKLARQAKQVADYTCQICGASVEGRREGFVEAHHVEPLSEGGLDRGENILVLCPNCHGHSHRGDLRVESVQTSEQAEGIRVALRDGKTFILTRDEDSEQAALQEELAVQEIKRRFELLSEARRRELLGQLIALM